jgi:acyl carrier protein
MLFCEDSVMQFLAEFTGVKRDRLSPTATLFGDLGVDGADGFELLRAFGERFDVDLSGCRAERHFGSEGLPIYAPIVWLWWLSTGAFRKQPEERAGLIPIRISDLIAAAREGRWSL